MTEVFQTLKIHIFQRAFGMALSSLRSRGRGKVNHHMVVLMVVGWNVSSKKNKRFIQLFHSALYRSFTSYSFSCPHIINITIMVSSICCYFSCIFVIFSLLFLFVFKWIPPPERCSVFPEEPGLRQVQHLSLKSALGEQITIYNNNSLKSSWF